LQNAELDTTLASKVKETLYLKRALESVYSRFSSNMQVRITEPQGKESEIDAELIANRTIDSLVKKDEEITSLKAQIAGLTEKMEKLKVPTPATPVPASEEEFKSMVAPPPPPPAPKPRPKRQITSASVVTMTNEVETTRPSLLPDPSPPPPPPPPPPPLLLGTSTTSGPVSTLSVRCDVFHANFMLLASAAPSKS